MKEKRIPDPAEDVPELGGIVRAAVGAGHLDVICRQLLCLDLFFSFLFLPKAGRL